jgi:hypothetical protein
MTTTQWGRKETIVRPSHSPIYSYGAAFVALVFTGLFLYLDMAVAMTPLQRWDLRSTFGRALQQWCGRPTFTSS